MGGINMSSEFEGVSPEMALRYTPRVTRPPGSHGS